MSLRPSDSQKSLIGKVGITYYRSDVIVGRIDLCRYAVRNYNVAVVALDDEVRDGPCRDLPGARVQDGVNPVPDVGVDVGRVLEGEPGVDEPAVHHLQVINVAESLVRLNGAVDEREVPRVPGKVLTGDIRVVDGNVLAVPEAVLGEELRVVDLDVAAAVEGVVAVEIEPVDIDVRGVHPEIVPLRGDVLEPYIAA